MSMTDPRFELLRMAIGFMAKKDARAAKYIEYAERVRRQVAIIEAEEGRKLETADWLLMAKNLGLQALSKDIGPRQIAESIYPLLDGSHGKLAAYAHVPAWLATQLLLAATNMSSAIEPQLKTLLIGIIGELQAMIKAGPPSTNPL